MIKLVCKECNYLFTSATIKKCPYCNSQNVIEDLDAEDLLEEIS